MLEAESWTRIGKSVRFSTEAELFKVTFLRLSQEELQIEEEMSHQEPETFNIPKSCLEELLSVIVCVVRPSKVRIPVPLVNVAPSAMLIFPRNVIFALWAVNVPADKVKVPSIVIAPLPPLNVPEIDISPVSVITPVV